jgi:hypothetical protein
MLDICKEIMQLTCLDVIADFSPLTNVVYILSQMATFHSIFSAFSHFFTVPFYEFLLAVPSRCPGGPYDIMVRKPYFTSLQ